MFQRRPILNDMLESLVKYLNQGTCPILIGTFVYMLRIVTVHLEISTLVGYMSLEWFKVEA